MDIKKLIAIIKKKIENEIAVDNLKIEDKSFLHKNHPGNEKNRYHLKISIESEELKKMSKIESNKKIYRILNEEMKLFIHSIQILLN
jgi:BolA family transcriptional regulator, general stress-responsive regulator